jgi:hypothetical protein
MKQQYHGRALTLAAFIAVFGFAILVQMVRIQTSPQAEAFRALNNMYEGEYHTIFPPRGEIYDRNGHLLAGNQTVYEVGVNLAAAEDPNVVAGIATVLNTVLGLDYGQVYSTINEAPADASYAFITDFVPPGKVAEIEGLRNLPADPSHPGRLTRSGCAFIPHLGRSYGGPLASNVRASSRRRGRGYFGVGKIQRSPGRSAKGRLGTNWPQPGSEMPQVPAVRI